jgi:hypothetical protein
VFPLETTELKNRLGRREAGAERPLLVVDEATAAMPPRVACLLGMTSGDLPRGSEEVVLGHESEDRVEQGVPLVVHKCSMRRLGTTSQMPSRGWEGVLVLSPLLCQDSR